MTARRASLAAAAGALLLCCRLPAAAALLVTRSAFVEALSCDHIADWLDVKVKAVELALAVDPSVADRKPGHPLLRTMIQQGHDILANMRLDACALGSRTLVHAVLLLAGLRQPPAPEMELLEWSTTPWSFSDLLLSGWPIFGLAGAYKRFRYQTHSDAWISLSGCRALARRAEGHMHPLLHVEKFVSFLWSHLQLRPKRRYLPREPVQAFLVFSQQTRGSLCQLAVAAAELAMAVALLSKDSSYKDGVTRKGRPLNGTVGAALRWATRAEDRLRLAWRDLAPADKIEDPTSFKLELMLSSMARVPILELLQAIQDGIFADERAVRPSVGVGADSDPAAHVGELEKKRPDYWQERRQLLREAVYGPAKSWLDGPLGPPKPEVQAFYRFNKGFRSGDTMSKSELVLRWDLGGKMNSTAFLARAWNRRPRGLVLLHNGHDSRVASLEERRQDPYQLIKHIVSLGFDVISLCMPWTGYNHLGKENPWGYHDHFQHMYDAGDRAVLAYFAAPVRLALDWAERELGHRRFAMVGFSGGGWTTYLAAALEPRISFSLAAVATLPPHLVDSFEWIHYDYELRYLPREAYRDCPMLCWFVLATVAGEGSGPRWGVHLFHWMEDFPYPTPNCAVGIGAELEDYYGAVLPRLAAAASGLAPEAASGTSSPLRLALTAPTHVHVGAWRDQALLEVFLERWAELGAPGVPADPSGPFPAEWPAPMDVRWGRGDWVDRAVAAA